MIHPIQIGSKPSSFSTSLTNPIQSYHRPCSCPFSPPLYTASLPRTFNVVRDRLSRHKRRLSIRDKDSKELSDDLIVSVAQCPNLSTLFLGDNDLKVIQGKFFQFMPSLVILNLSRNEYLSELPEEIYSLISLQYLNLSRTVLLSIDGIGTSLPNLQVLKLYCSCVFIDARSIEELQLLEHLKILTVNVKDALMLESIQGMERLARCVQRLWILDMSAEVLTLNTVAPCCLRELHIMYSKISEIKIDWKSKEKEDLLCNSSPYFRHLSSIAIYDLEGPKELTWLLFAPNLKHLHVTSSGRIEEIINKEKGMSISNVHPDLTVPFAKLESLRLRGLNELKRICSSPPALPSLKNIVVEYCRKLPKAATESFQDTIKNNEDAE
ncbi:unnamed protein product [Brassica oleracea]